MIENPPVFPELPRNQRVVFEHTAGPYAGLHEICGHSDDYGGGQPPLTTEPFKAKPDGRTVVAGLVRSAPRYVLYRETTMPDNLGTFDQRQQ